MNQPLLSSVDLTELLEKHRGERHLIVLHNFPDPDAIACAYAHQLISKEYEIQTDIVYTGGISHQQNQALVKWLGVELIVFQEGMNWGHYQGAVFLDHQGATVEEIIVALEEAGVSVLLVVDHHKPHTRVVPECTVIVETGSTATIYASFLEKGLMTLEKTNKDHVLMATALLHGVLTDTGSFIQAGEQDFHAAAFLSQYRDSDLLNQIMSQERSKHVMDVIHSALENRETVESFSIAGIGYVRGENRDIIPQAADFLLTEENVHTAVVYGIVKVEDRETLVGSLRTSKFTLDPDRFIKEAFGKSAEGLYFGGGRQLAGGFAIPLGFLSNGAGAGDEFQKLKWKTYDAQIKHKIYAKIGVDGNVRINEERANPHPNS